MPAYYLGDDDFWTADRAVSVNIPWYLANPTLWRLVNDHLFEYTREEVLMYLRHEAGHALNYAFELWRRKDWTQTFGDFRRPYRDVYNPNPWSRDYVRYLHRAGHVPLRAEASRRGLGRDVRGLAGSAARWRRRYRDWQVALAKLEYVDRDRRHRSAPVAAAPSNVRLGMRVPYTEIKETVAEYFDIDDDDRPGPAGVPEGPARDLPAPAAARPRDRRPRPGSRTANAQSAARFIQQHQNILDRPHQPLDRRQRQARIILRFLRQLQAVCTARAHGRPRRPPHREAGRADGRRHLARRRRHPPSQLTAALTPFGGRLYDVPVARMAELVDALA